MAPSLVESAFDTMSQRVEGYAGNPVFDVAMGHLKDFDWNTIDTNSAKELAKNIGAGLVDTGKDFAKEYVGKSVGAGIAAVGLTTGVTQTALIGAGLGMAVGSAIDWAVDFFTSEGWGTSGNEGYNPGDWVAIDVSVGARELPAKEGLRRRRLVKEGVNVGVVSKRQDGGYVSIQNVQTGTNQAYAINQIKKLPSDVVSKLESNTDLKQIHDVYATQSTFPPEQLNARTSTVTGDKVSYRGEQWNIEAGNQDNVTIVSGGQRLEVAWDDEKLEDE